MDAAPTIQSVVLQIDQLWVLIAAVLVFLMQAGFLALEIGAVRQKATVITAMKNLMDWVACLATFYLIGWALMFGHSAGGLVGHDLFFLSGGTDGGHAIGLPIHFLFQVVFAGTAATIVSGALAERVNLLTYFICSVFISLIIYPIFGHWAWGNSYFAENVPWLVSLGFMDFAGSTVVHSVGGWVALVGVVMVGARLGRFGPNGEVNEIKPFSLAITALGALILWFGWWGFNGGSTLALNNQVGPIIINTCLAGAFGAITSFLHCLIFQKGRGMTSKFISGAIGGLVGITAGCFIVSGAGAIAIGIVSGLICNWGTDFLLKKRIDDPVGVIPVHLFCGIWGTLAVALFGNADMMAYGRWYQLAVQFVGVVACAVWVVGISYLLFRLLRATTGLRISPREEINGYNIENVAVAAADLAPAQTIDAEEAARLMGAKG